MRNSTLPTNGMRQPQQVHLVGRQGRVDQPRGARPENEADRRSGRRGAADEPAHERRRLLGGVDHRPGELAAEREALDDAHQHQQQRRGHADLRVGRQQAQDERGAAHQARSRASAARAGRCGRRPSRARCCRSAAPGSRARTRRTSAAAAPPRCSAGRTGGRCRWRSSRRRRSRTTRGRSRSGRPAPSAGRTAVPQAFRGFEGCACRTSAAVESVTEASSRGTAILSQYSSRD